MLKLMGKMIWGGQTIISPNLGACYNYPSKKFEDSMEMFLEIYKESHKKDIQNVGSVD